MNLIFISTGEYPDTHAAAIRHSTLAKGLVEQGHSVIFLLLSSQKWSEENALSYFGIQFRSLNNYKGNNKILKKYYTLKALSKAKKIIKVEKGQNKADAIIIFTIEILPIQSILTTAYHLKIKIFHERTELPYILENNKRLLNYYLKKLLPRFDGIFVISDKLDNYIKQFNKNTKKLLTVVDVSFFNAKKANPYNFSYIAYCGTINGTKDGVPILIEAFASIADKFPELKLVLVGNNSNKNAIKETLDAINKFKVEEKIIFSGLVDREMIPLILCNAKLLVLSKPDNEQNSGNFPIKIGEYLATGVPVVVTSVGEIPSFIKDGETGFLALPDNALSFASKMEEALQNSNRAKIIGLNGKKIAENIFNYKIQADIMANYIREKINL